MMQTKPDLVPTMMFRPLALLILTSLAACNATWKVQDADGDGYTPLDGDCWDSVAGPGVGGLSGADIHPAATEAWYDGFDQDCAGDDDYDQDLDGYVPDTYQGLATSNVEDSGQLPAGDCWDDPLVVPEDQRVVSSSLTDAQGTSLSWEQPAAAGVYPGATELWYDGADSDCSADSDFDQDADGFDTEAYPNRAGSFGDDCLDGADIDPDNPAGLDPGEINPDASETWYDGTDQDCDANDCDADGDGYDADPAAVGYCENDDCDDTDPARFPDPSIPEVWYNGVDENCDNNDGDQDGDDYWALDYLDQVAANGGTPMDVPVGFEGDCDDVDFGTHPGAADAWYDGVDADCAGDDDYDQDLDGFQYDAHGGTDCDDTNADINPDVIEIWYDGVDADCDDLSDYDQDLDGHDSDAFSGTDCDDTDGAINPDASETWYDGVDADCDDASDYDQDADGYDSDGYSGTDCDDTDSGVNPAAVDVWYDGVDADCDGASDYDQDADGYDSDGYSGADCDDTDGAINPGASEIWYDGVDGDCSGGSDYDQDGDGYGTSAHIGTDCDDTVAGINPGIVTDDATTFNMIDDDCDGWLDEDAIGTGSLIITEISRTSTAGSTGGATNSDANWFELYNAESFDIALDDVHFRFCYMYGTGYGGGFPDSIPSWLECESIDYVAVSPDAGLALSSGGYATFCYDDSLWDDPTDCDYVWSDTSTWTGSNPSGHDYGVDDTMFLDQNGIIGAYYAGSSTDEVGWYFATDGSSLWPYRSKYTMTLSLSAYDPSDNDDGSYWCDADNANVWASSPNNYGTPGSSDSGCP